MPVTGTQAEARVQKALGGTPVGRTKAQLANDAGDLLLTLHPWRWAISSDELLDLTADQAHVWLPLHVRDVIAVQLVETGTWLSATGHGELLEMRAVEVGSWAGPAWYAIEHAVNEDASDEYQARLALYPTPGDTEADALRLRYVRGWTPWDDDDATNAAIPRWIEHVYLDLVAAVARGWEDDFETPGIKSSYVQQVLSGAPFIAAVKRDSQIQPTIGAPLRGMMPGGRRISVSVLTPEEDI